MSPRHLPKLLDSYKRQFGNHGRFRLSRGQDLRSCIVENSIPNLPAAYLIYGIKKGARELLEIGKSGTVRTDGSFKSQGLAVRLRMKQGKTWRAEYYAAQMTQRKLDALEFEWYVTFDDSAKVLPLKAEADLLQAYFDEEGRLPLWNLAA